MFCADLLIVDRNYKGFNRFNGFDLVELHKLQVLGNIAVVYSK